MAPITVRSLSSTWGLCPLKKMRKSRWQLTHAWTRSQSDWCTKPGKRVAVYFAQVHPEPRGRRRREGVGCCLPACPVLQLRKCDLTLGIGIRDSTRTGRSPPARRSRRPGGIAKCPRRGGFLQPIDTTLRRRVGSQLIGFLELILVIEKKLGVRLRSEDLNGAALTTVNGLVRHVVAVLSRDAAGHE